MTTAAPMLDDLDDLPAVETAGVLTANNFDVTVHDATLTIRNPATNNHRTFAIRTVHQGALKGKRIVSLLVGPDTFQGFGFADEFGVHVWVKMRYAKEGLAFSAYEKFARMLENPTKYEGLGAEYLIAGRCVRCGKILTRPDSVKDSMGAECRSKMGG